LASAAGKQKTVLAAEQGGIVVKKRMFRALLALAMLFTLLPVSAFAEEPDGFESVYIQSDTPLIPGETVRSQGRAVTNVGGHHEKWIDRLDFPDFAKSFYRTLETGAVRNGFLVDFSKAEQRTFNMKDGYSTTAYMLDIPFTGDTMDALDYISAAYSAFLRDYPEVFWLSGDINLIYINNNNSICFILNSTSTNGEVFSLLAADYKNASPDEINQDIDRRDGYIQTIKSGMPAGADTYAKVKYFNSWLTQHNGYNSSTQLSEASIGSFPRSCLCALAGTPRSSRSPVCEGYSKGFMALCKSEGIPCVLVDSSDHMWNYVQMDDGRWYGVDVTFNDPIISNNSDGQGTEDWLLVGGAKMDDGQHVVANQPSNTASAPCFTNGPLLEVNDYQHVPGPSTPVSAADFTCSLPTSLVYDGTSKTAAVRRSVSSTIHNGYFTLAFTDTRDNPVTDLVKPGTYRVLAKVSAHDGYDAAAVSLGSVTITEASGLHGKVSFSVSDTPSQEYSDTAYVISGVTITVRVLPDPGYQLGTIQIVRADNGQLVSLSGSGNVRTFSMPSSDVSIRVDFSIS